MALQLIVGASGSGKTERIFHEIITQSIEYPDQRYLLIVPEQSTMILQREVVKRHPRHATANIDVVSFPRLAYHIFSELKYQPKPTLDELGKSMVLQKIMEENRDRLSLFGRSGDKIGFIQELKSLISEFYQYHVSAEQLRALIREEENPLLRMKLSDLVIVMEEFDAFLQKGYCTSEQIPGILSEKMGESSLIAESYIYMDGFTGYTPDQYELIGQLLRCAKQVTVAVTIDLRENFYRNRDYELFSLSKTTIQKLERRAKEENAVVLPALVMPDDPKQGRLAQSPELFHLEQNLFRYPYHVWEKPTERLHIWACASPREEAEYVADAIQEMVAQGDFRYRDIAIVAGDMERYRRELENSLKKRGLSYFIDSTNDMFQNPCIESVRAVMEMVDRNFTYESVFRYLKAGLSGLSRKEYSLLENYVIACGIRGFSRWKKPFARLTKGMTEEQLAEINRTREQFVDTVSRIRDVLASRRRTVREQIEALYDFLLQEQYEERMLAMAEQLAQDGEPALADSYRQVYPAVISLLDQTVELLGDIRLPVGQLQRILDVGLDHIRLGVIPPCLDQIMVGDLERSRFHRIKALFFVGMNEGIVPKPPAGGGILTDADRQAFSARRIELAPDAKQSVSQEQFYFYLCMSKPSEQLFLTYAGSGTDGKALRPSYLIGRLRTIFPRLEIVGRGEYSPTLSHITSKELGREYLAEGLREYKTGTEKEEWDVFYAAAKELPELSGGLDLLIDCAFYRNTESSLGSALASALYGTVLRNSVTRLEMYARCAFAHFMRYGLGLEPRQEYAVRALDIGNVLHQTVELFSRAMGRMEEGGWRQIGAEKRDALVEQFVDRSIEEYQLSMLDETKRDQYMRRTIARIAKRTVWALQQQVCRGSFQPHAYELSFSGMDQLDAAHVRLSDDAHMELVGKIDRIDRYEDDEHIYLKIIDYKSGATTFQVQDMNYGLQIQLMVYLNAAVELEKRNSPGKTVIPAGLFYFNMKDPLIPGGTAEKDRELELLRAMKLSGFVNSDRTIVELMEKPVEQEFVTLPVKLTKNGEFTKNSYVADTGQLQGMERHVRQLVHTLGGRMMQGDIAIAPYMLGTKTACDYCQYKTICKFETKEGINTFRRLKNRNTEELLRQFGRQEGSESDAMDHGAAAGH